MHRFLPITYRLDDPLQTLEFLQRLSCEEFDDQKKMWIFKKTGLSGGKGIFLLNNNTEIRERFYIDHQFCDLLVTNELGWPNHTQTNEMNLTDYQHVPQELLDEFREFNSGLIVQVFCVLSNPRFEFFPNQKKNHRGG